MDSKKLKNRFVVTISGTVLVALCCFTPLLVITVTGIGLGLFIPYLDFVLLPALLFMLILSFVSYKRWRKKEDVSDKTT
jgi:mercuric ion transport protein